VKKIILISLFYFFSFSALASFAKVKIFINSGLDVIVTAQSIPFIFEKNEQGFVIQYVVVKTSDLNVKPSLVAAKIKKKKFLHVEQYPEITVNSIVCEEMNHQCKLNLRIKNNEKTILANYSSTESAILLKFHFLLSDFDIAQSISFWKIENQAQVEVDILK
jgi:YceI-like domain